MRRFVLLAVVVVGASAEPAAAQFGGFNPYAGAYSRQFSFRTNYGYYSTPYGTIGFQYRRYSTANYAYPFALGGSAYPALYAPVVPGASTVVAVAPYFYGAGGYGAVVSVGYDADAARLARAQRENRADPAAPRRNTNGPTFDPMPAGGNAVAEAADADIRSGKALNDIAAEIRKLDGKKAARSPFFPPELLAKATFAGGPAADAINLFRDEPPAFPAGLVRADTVEARAEAIAAFDAVSTTLHAGKKVDPAQLDKLLTAAERLKPGSDPESQKYVARWTAAVKAMKDSTTSGVVVPTWYSIGTSGADLLKHMTTHKLTFAAAPENDDGAYAAMYRGLAGYLADLNAAR